MISTEFHSLRHGLARMGALASRMVRSIPLGRDQLPRNRGGFRKMHFAAPWMRHFSSAPGRLFSSSNRNQTQRGLILGLVLLGMMACFQLVEMRTIYHSQDLPGVPGDIKGDGSSAAKRSVTLRHAGVQKAASLFGIWKSEIQDQLPSEIPDTALGLTLRGIFNFSAPRPSLVIVEVGGEDKVLEQGRQIQPGVVIAHIYSDRIILKRGGKLETLRLPVKTEGLAANEQTFKSGNSRRNKLQAQPGSMRPNISTLTDIQASSLGDVIRPQPVYENGKLIGFRALPGPRRDLFDQSGLKKGDVVTAVNGQLLNQPLEAMKAFARLRQAQQAQLDLQRNGENHRLNLAVERGQGGGR